MTLRTHEALTPLVTALSERFADDALSKPTRANWIELLGILHEHIGAEMAEPLGKLDCGSVYEAEHNASTLIGTLISALRGLDTGKVDPELKPVKFSSQAAKEWRQQEIEELIRVSFRMVRDLGGHRTDKAAAMALARHLRLCGYTIRGKFITWRMIIDLKYR